MIKDIGYKIRQARLDAGMTQQELAKKLSTSQKNVSNWEKGINMPRLDTIKKISDATQRTIVYSPEDIPDGMNNHTDFIQAWLRKSDYYMLYDIAKDVADRADTLIARRMRRGPEHHKHIWQMRLNWHRKQVEGVLERRDKEEMIAAVTLWSDQVKGLLYDSEK